MLPNKFTSVTKSKLYKAISYYRSIPEMLIPKPKIKNYEEIEFITILYAFGYITDGGEDYFVKIR